MAAEAGLRLKFRTGGLEASAFPTAEVLAGWIDAALDRETPFKCTAGLHNAVRHTGETASSTTASSTSWSRPGVPSTAPRCDEVVEVLEQRDGATLVADAARARPGRSAALVHVVRLLLGRPSRWPTCASWAACS